MIKKQHVCPVCGSSLTRPIRVCFNCGQQIVRGEKWRYILTRISGKQITTVAHRNCKDTQNYKET